MFSRTWLMPLPSTLWSRWISLSNLSLDFSPSNGLLGLFCSISCYGLLQQLLLLLWSLWIPCWNMSNLLSSLAWSVISSSLSSFSFWSTITTWTCPSGVSCHSSDGSISLPYTCDVVGFIMPDVIATVATAATMASVADFTIAVAATALDVSAFSLPIFTTFFGHGKLEQ